MDCRDSELFFWNVWNAVLFSWKIEMLQYFSKMHHKKSTFFRYQRNFCTYKTWMIVSTSNYALAATCWTFVFSQFYLNSEDLENMAESSPVSRVFFKIFQKSFVKVQFGLLSWAHFEHFTGKEVLNATFSILSWKRGWKFKNKTVEFYLITECIEDNKHC